MDGLSSSSFPSYQNPPSSNVHQKTLKIVSWVLVAVCFVATVVCIVMFLMKKPIASCTGGSNVTCAGDMCTCTQDCKCTAGEGVTCDEENVCSCTDPPKSQKCTAGTNVTCDSTGQCNVADDWKGDCPSTCTLSNLCPRCYSGQTDSFDPRQTGDTCFMPNTLDVSSNFTQLPFACGCDLKYRTTNVLCDKTGWTYKATDSNFECTKD